MTALSCRTRSPPSSDPFLGAGGEEKGGQRLPSPRLGDNIGIATVVYVPASPGKSSPVRVVWGGLWGEGGSGLDLYLSRSVSCPGLALFASSESVKR